MRVCASVYLRAARYVSLPEDQGRAQTNSSNSTAVCVCVCVSVYTFLQRAEHIFKCHPVYPVFDTGCHCLEGHIVNEADLSASPGDLPSLPHHCQGSRHIIMS